jgi:hypothetical protein
VRRESPTNGKAARRNQRERSRVTSASRRPVQSAPARLSGHSRWEEECCSHGTEANGECGIRPGTDAEGRVMVRSEKSCVTGGESPPSLEAKPPEFRAKAMDRKVLPTAQDQGLLGGRLKRCETLKAANRPQRRDASAVADLAGKALQLRVFAPLLFMSAPPVPLNPAILNALSRRSCQEKLILLAPLLGVLLGFKHPANCGQVGHRRGNRVPETT